MGSRSSGALVLGFGALLFLIGLLGFGALQRAGEMYQQMIATQRAYEETDQAIRSLPADLHLAGILERDYVLDSSPTAAAEYKRQLAQEHDSIERHIARLGALGATGRDKVERLKRETQAYADSLDPLLNWSPQEKLARSDEFTRQNLIPRRQSIIQLAEELSTLNAQNLAIERSAQERSQEGLRRFVRNLLWICLGLGAIVAILSIWRVVRLENDNRLERRRVEDAEREQRRLAMRVVQAQEEERKRISLELHDAVGQMVSALGMELGRLESAHLVSAAQFHGKLAEVKQMNNEVIHAIKQLAGGLRPAMLDDLGLGPALRAHAREFSRRTGVPVDVRMEGEIESVPEPQRTCIYRIVQEALNNCGNHAHAKHAVIFLAGRTGAVGVTVQDDGIGFDTTRRPRTGLGLVGIQERARDLGGTFQITSKVGQGTLLTVELPVKEVVNA